MSAVAKVEGGEIVQIFVLNDLALRKHSLDKHSQQPALWLFYMEDWVANRLFEKIHSKSRVCIGTHTHTHIRARAHTPTYTHTWKTPAIEGVRWHWGIAWVIFEENSQNSALQSFSVANCDFWECLTRSRACSLALRHCGSIFCRATQGIWEHLPPRATAARWDTRIQKPLMDIQYI